MGRAIVLRNGSSEVRETTYTYKPAKPGKTKGLTAERPATPPMIVLKNGVGAEVDLPMWKVPRERAVRGETVLLYERGDSIWPVFIKKEVSDEEGWMSEILDEDTMRMLRKTTMQTERLGKSSLRRFIEAMTPILGMVLLVGAVVMALYFIGDFSTQRAAAIVGEAKKSTLLNMTTAYIGGGA